MKTLFRQPFAFHAITILLSSCLMTACFHSSSSDDNKNNEEEPKTGVVEVPAVTNLKNDATLNLSQLVLSGNGAEGNLIEIIDGNGDKWGNAVLVDDSGNWTIKLNELVEDEYSFKVVATNQSTNESKESEVFTFTIDLTKPDAPAITTTYAADAIETDAQPGIAGTTSETNSTIEVFADSVSVGTTSVDDEGNWSLTLTSPLLDGTNTLTAISIDVAGNRSENSNELVFTVDARGPLAPEGLANKAEIASYQSVDFSWSETTDNNDISTIDSYTIQIATDSAFTAESITSEQNTGLQTNFSFSQAVAGTRYYARVRAKDALNHDGEWSEVSEVNVVALNLEYASAMASSENFVKAVKIDSAGNTILGGYFTGDFTIDDGTSPITLSAGQTDNAYVIKRNTDGNIIWHKTLASGFTVFTIFIDGIPVQVKDYVRITNLSTDSENNIYIIGYFSGPVDFDFDDNSQVGNFQTSQGEGGERYSNFFIAKLSGADGSHIWSHAYLATGFDYAFGITVDSNDNIYVTGRFQSPEIDFDPDDQVSVTKTLISDIATLPTASSGSDLFITKLDKNGGHIWSQNFGGGQDTFNGFSAGHSIALNNSETEIVVTGSVNGALDFNPSLVNSGEHFAFNTPNIVTASFSSDSGTYNWSRQIVAWSEDVDENSFWGGENAGSWLVTNDLNEIFIASYFKGEANFTQQDGAEINSNANSNDIFITKLNASGEYQWTQTIGSSGDDRAEGITLDSDNNLFVTGRYSATVDFDFSDNSDSFTATGTHDAFVSKLFADDSYGWTRTFESVASDTFGRAIAVAGNKIVTAGNLSGETDFDPNIASTIAGTAATNGVYITEHSVASP